MYFDPQLAGQSIFLCNKNTYYIVFKYAIIQEQISKCSNNVFLL
jgi:hypothetical protein